MQFIDQQYRQVGNDSCLHIERQNICYDRAISSQTMSHQTKTAKDYREGHDSNLNYTEDTSLDMTRGSGAAVVPAVNMHNLNKTYTPIGHKHVLRNLTARNLAHDIKRQFICCPRSKLLQNSQSSGCCQSCGAFFYLDTRGLIQKAIRPENLRFKHEVALHHTVTKMNEHSQRTLRDLRPINSYLKQRQALVDWLSGVGESLNISNQAVHHAVHILDIYASKLNKDFDIILAALGSLLACSKFVQMKYPSADSLNSATQNEYTFDDIVGMEFSLLQRIDWQLLQYTVYDFVNMFMEHGCIFESDRILQSETATEDADKDGKVNTSHCGTFRRYAEFFTDFCIQEETLIRTEPLLLSCSIIGATRKQMNFKIIWTYQLTALTGTEFSQIQETFHHVDRMYARSFPESARNQIQFANNRQKLETPARIIESHQSITHSSSKAAESATTMPHTNYMHSSASGQTKYDSVSKMTSQPGYERSRDNSQSHCATFTTEMKDVSNSRQFEQENQNINSNYLTHQVSLQTIQTKAQDRMENYSNVSAKPRQPSQTTNPEKKSIKGIKLIRTNTCSNLKVKNASTSRVSASSMTKQNSLNFPLTKTSRGDNQSTATSHNNSQFNLNQNQVNGEQKPKASMDISDDIVNEKGSNFITLDNTILSRKPLLGKRSQPMTSRNCDAQKAKDSLNFQGANLDLMGTNFGMPAEGTFMVQTLNNKKTPMASVGVKQSVFRTIEEAKIQTSQDQPDAPKQKLKVVGNNRFSQHVAKPNITKPNFKLQKKHQVLGKKPSLNSKISIMTKTGAPIQKSKPVAMLGQPSSTRHSNQKNYQMFNNSSDKQSSSMTRQFGEAKTSTNSYLNKTPAESISQKIREQLILSKQLKSQASVVNESRQASKNRSGVLKQVTTTLDGKIAPQSYSNMYARLNQRINPEERGTANSHRSMGKHSQGKQVDSCLLTKSKQNVATGQINLSQLSLTHRQKSKDSGVGHKPPTMQGSSTSRVNATFIPNMTAQKSSRNSLTRYGQSSKALNTTHNSSMCSLNATRTMTYNQLNNSIEQSSVKQQSMSGPYRAPLPPQTQREKKKIVLPGSNLVKQPSQGNMQSSRNHMKQNLQIQTTSQSNSTFDIARAHIPMKTSSSVKNAKRYLHGHDEFSTSAKNMR